MRSQATKSSPKKGAASKTSFKRHSTTKHVKKKTTPSKKVKKLIKKSLVKSPKNQNLKSDIKKDEYSAFDDKSELTTNETQNETPKSVSRSNSPNKKNKKGVKEKKEETVPTAETSHNKKDNKKTLVKSDTKSNKKKAEQAGEEIVKYKINSELLKPLNSKTAKSGKSCTKKSATVTQIKLNSHAKHEKNERDKVKDGNKCDSTTNNTKENSPQASGSKDGKEEVTENLRVPEEFLEKPENSESKTNTQPPLVNSETVAIVINTPPEPVAERPPKFFTSTRSPRTVDIDVKCCKTNKCNISVSDRFLSMKSEESAKDKANASNNLISQDQEFDVYTFTDYKIDSPKSILAGFRSPMNKNVGRVRPIARVKGTIIDKNKTEVEKKKYSPHRPIEEVVKQLKAGKKAEDAKLATHAESLSANVLDSNSSSGNESCTLKSLNLAEEKTKHFVSKSYKMVARKINILGRPFCPIKPNHQEHSENNKEIKNFKKVIATKKSPTKPKKSLQKKCISDEDIDRSKFSINTKSKSVQYSSSEESISESNDDNDSKESSESDEGKKKRAKNKRPKKLMDSIKKSSLKELRELSKDSLIDVKDSKVLLGNEKPSKRRLKLLSMWTGPKKHRMASLNALAKVHCLYENESRSHVELGLMRTVDRAAVTSLKQTMPRKRESKGKDTEKRETTSESEYEAREKHHLESSEEDAPIPSTRTLRGVPGIRSAGKYWVPKSSTSSSEDSELDSKKKLFNFEKKKANVKPSPVRSDTEKPPTKIKKTAGDTVKKKRVRSEVVMDLKDMVVQKRMASLNATAILAASYEKRSPKSSKDDTTSDSCSDESFSQKSKNGVSSGVKSEEIKKEETKKEGKEGSPDNANQNVEVIVNQDTDVTITGVYATHQREGFCTVSGLQYRISSTSHTQTTATSNCDKCAGCTQEKCSREEGSSRYTPLSALSSMQPPEQHAHNHPHPVPELGGLTRRGAGCSSAFSAPSPSSHHEPGYYQPAGPLIKETGAEAERTLARYHPPPPHYHAPHPPVLQQYGSPYYPADLCYGRYYRPPAPTAYHIPGPPAPGPQPEPQMVGVAGEPYPPPQYYGTPTCYQHAPQRVPYIEYRGCPCPMNACPKNVLIGPATGKAPTGGGPVDVSSAQIAPPGGSFRTKVRAAHALSALEGSVDAHGSGKDPPLEAESPAAAAEAPRPCLLPTALGGASPQRELYDSRDNLRHAAAGDTPGPAEAVGPPSPARGSAGACAPQPPPQPPRRARLGKAMARRSLAGDDTRLLMTSPNQPQTTPPLDLDDDVLALSPPENAPIDLSSSDETDRRPPIIDIKKENEGPTHICARKLDTQALREHNSTSIPAGNIDNDVPSKAIKRRYSKPKLEIELCEVELNNGCQTNCISEHVKLQKRRKLTTEVSESITKQDSLNEKESKKKSPLKPKRPPKSIQKARKKCVKRKTSQAVDIPQKKLLLDEKEELSDSSCKNVALLSKDSNLKTINKPKNKSSLLLDNLIRKNSIDRIKSNEDLEAELNPAKLFLASGKMTAQTQVKKTNINNNNIDMPIINGVRPNAVVNKISNKLACNLISKVGKKTTSKNNLTTNHTSSSIDTVLKFSADVKTEKTDSHSESHISSELDRITKENNNTVTDINEPCLMSKEKTMINEKHTTSESTEKRESINVCEKSQLFKSDHTFTCNSILGKLSGKQGRPKLALRKPENNAVSSKNIFNKIVGKFSKSNSDTVKTQLLSEKTKPIIPIKQILEKPTIDTIASKLADSQISAKLAQNSAIDKLINSARVEKLSSKMKICMLSENNLTEDTEENIVQDTESSIAKRLTTKVPDEKLNSLIKKNNVQSDCKNKLLVTKRPGLKAIEKSSCDLKDKSEKTANEKVAKLLVSKKPADEIRSDLMEEVCTSPLVVPIVGRRVRRRRSIGRRQRRMPALLAPPTLDAVRTTPRWSNGWSWYGEPYLAKVYLNNDSRLDRLARCWARMSHTSGDHVERGDCVLLRASSVRAQPFVARVARLWENPDDGEMMVSLVWYYRPEHTELGRQPDDAPDEVFASRHRDANSVACIEDKCYVLTYNEYCRYRKRLKAAEEGISVPPSIVPLMPSNEIIPAVASNDSKLPPSVSPELVLFCRKIYDFRSKKIQAPNK